MHLHQSSSLPGKPQRFHKSAGPPWFSRDHLYALAERQPEKQEGHLDHPKPKHRLKLHSIVVFYILCLR